MEGGLEDCEGTSPQGESPSPKSIVGDKWCLSEVVGAVVTGQSYPWGESMGKAKKLGPFTPVAQRIGGC